MLDFISENYVWFIVGGVILFMALIGYIAERTDFGRKQFEKRVKPEKVKKEKPVKESKDNKANSEELIIEPDIVEPVIIEENNNVENINNEENANEENINFGEDLELTNQINMDEDLTVPLENLKIDNEENAVVSEDLYAPLDLKIDDYNDSKEDNAEETTVNENDVKEEVEEFVEEPFMEIDTTEPVVSLNEEKTEEIELPKIEDLKDEVSDEEDVWKF